MNLLDTFKAVSAINQANEFVKNHEDMINRVKSLVKNVQHAISFLEATKDIIQEQINKAKSNYLSCLNDDERDN